MRVSDYCGYPARTYSLALRLGTRLVTQLGYKHAVHETVENRRKRRVYYVEQAPRGT